MTVKVLVMKSGEDVIADVQEMVNADQQVIGYFLTKPVVVKLTSNPTKDELDPDQPEKKSDISISMFPWMPLAREKAIPISTDWVVTMVTPQDKIEEMYTQDVLKNFKNNDQIDNPDEPDKAGLTD